MLIFSLIKTNLATTAEKHTNRYTNRGEGVTANFYAFDIQQIETEHFIAKHQRYALYIAGITHIPEI
jgi:hypothetical protein